MFRARVFGERMAAIGQSLAARLRLAMKDRGIPLWLDSPMTELITDADGTVTGAVVEHDGRTLRIGARGGVILATGGFDHDIQWRRQYLPVLDHLSSATRWRWATASKPARRSAESTELLDEAWWFPAICWPDGRLQFMLNERMMPSQFVVNGEGKRFINEAAPYMDFAHAMIEGQRSGVTHIPCWLITDIRSFHRYVVAGHLPIPKVPFAPVPTGWKVPTAWLESGVVKESRAGTNSRTRSACRPTNSAGRPSVSTNWHARATTTTSTAATAPTTTTTGTDTAKPEPAPLTKPPYYAFQVILGDLGTSGGLRTDEHARVLREDDTAVRGLYATGQHLGCGHRPQLRRRRSHHRSGHDIRLRGRATHRHHQHTRSFG